MAASKKKGPRGPMSPERAKARQGPTAEQKPPKAEAQRSRDGRTWEDDPEARPGEGERPGRPGGRAPEGEMLERLPSPRTDSCARACATPEERIRYIIDLMTTGRWITGRTVYELVEVWGLSASTVKQNAAEASRLVRDSLGSPEEIKAKVFGFLEEAAEMARRETFSPAKGASAMVQVAKTFADISGVTAPQKVAITDTAGKDLPPVVAGLLEHPAIARWAILNNRLPTEAEKAKILAEAGEPETPAEVKG